MEKINWKMFDGTYISIKDMTNTHIINTYNYLKGLGKTTIPSNWCGRTHLEWLKIFENEIKLRKYEIFYDVINEKFVLIFKNLN
jgi:hypothetical protein